MRPCLHTDNPSLSPYVCFRCRTQAGARQYFVDIGADTDFEGAVYICNNCLKDIVDATQGDFLHSTDHQTALRSYMEMYVHNTEAKDELAGVKSVLEYFNIDLARLKELYAGPGRVDEDVSATGSSESGSPTAIEQPNHDDDGKFDVSPVEALSAAIFGA